jgi:hypothetical protein
MDGQGENGKEDRETKCPVVREYHRLKFILFIRGGWRASFGCLLDALQLSAFLRVFQLRPRSVCTTLTTL